MGVHGNGLSHALWMKPGSAMLEFMMPGGFAKVGTISGGRCRILFSLSRSETDVCSGLV